VQDHLGFNIHGAADAGALDRGYVREHFHSRTLGNGGPVGNGGAARGGQAVKAGQYGTAERRNGGAD